MYKVIFLILATFLMFGCQAEEPQKASETAKRYPLTGKVISVDKAAKRARIEHEDIPGFMEKMTMDFPIMEDWVWEDLVPGAIVYAELVVDSTAKEPYWLEKISISAAPNPDIAQPEVKEPEQIGKEVPNASLTNQDGKRFSLSDYKGKVVAVTFIYRECPLPEFCIKMSRNFSDAALRLNEDAENKDKIRLLSISFDPERDTPAKLRDYGIGYMGNPEKPDFTVWQLAVGPDAEVRKVADFFGLKYEIDEQDKAQFNHSLVTAVIDRDGKVAKMLPSNRWSADDLVREVTAVAKK